jgi:FkbM family methyltransferase
MDLAGQHRDRRAAVSTLRGLPRRLRHQVWRLLYAAGYNVTNVARERERAARSSGDKWRWLDTLDVGTLVDVGANVGQFARGFLQQRPGSLVYSFEPLEDCFHELQKGMAGVPGFTAFNVALGDSEGEVDFYRSKSSASSSLLPMGTAHKELFPFTSEITSEKVTLRTLDSFFGSITIRGGLLIKIDVQGAEARVLGGGRRLLDRADAVVAEVGYFSLYDGQATIGTISGALAEHGLTFMGFVDQYVRPSDSLPVYGDVLFVRPSSLGPNPPVAPPAQGEPVPEAFD